MVAVRGGKGSASSPGCPHSQIFCHFAEIYIMAKIIIPATPTKATLLASRATPALWGPLVAEAMGAPVEGTTVGLKAVEPTPVLTAVPGDIELLAVEEAAVVVAFCEETTEVTVWSLARVRVLVSTVVDVSVVVETAETPKARGRAAAAKRENFILNSSKWGLLWLRFGLTGESEVQVL